MHWWYREPLEAYGEIGQKRGQGHNKVPPRPAAAPASGGVLMSMWKSAAAVGTLAIILAGCSGDGLFSSSPSTSATPQYDSGPREMKIAVVGPQSGGNDVFGRQLNRGVSAAVAEVTARGGLLG